MALVLSTKCLPWRQLHFRARGRSAFLRPAAAQEQRAGRSNSSADSGNVQTGAEELFEAFWRARLSSGDFISRTSDYLWKQELQLDQQLKPEESEESWKLGVDEPPADNTSWEKSVTDRRRAKEEFRRQCLLEYEALKRELSLVSLAIGTVCAAYTALVFSVEAAASYAIGVAGSLVYLQLLAYQADRVSEENVPEVFLERRKRRIGITSDDLRYSFQKNIQGVVLGLSSPRLLLPIGLYALWLGSRQLCQEFSVPFSFEIAPMMVGFFAYKAAALVQAYRDNKDLLIIFPEEESHG